MNHIEAEQLFHRVVRPTPSRRYSSTHREPAVASWQPRYLEKPPVSVRDDLAALAGYSGKRQLPAGWSRLQKIFL